MEIFNKKRIAELEEIIKTQENALETFREEIIKKNSKKHKTGAWCNGCKNLVVHQAFGCYPTQFCILDNECEDRKA